MPILKNSQHELLAYPGYNCARWPRRHGKPGRLDFERSFRSGRCAVRVDDKFYANFAAKMDEGELNTIASELNLLGLVIETAIATSVSSSAPPEGMSTVRHPLLLAACSLFQGNAMDEMLPAADPVKVDDDRPQKPKSADMMGHDGASALRWHQPVLHSAGAASAGTSYAGSPHPQPGVGAPGGSPPRPSAAAGMRRLRSPSPARRWVRLPLAALCPVLGRAPLGAAYAGDARHFEEQARDAIEDALEKDMNHYLIFWRIPTISAAAAMIISLLQSGLKSAGRSDADGARLGDGFVII
jgi:hypothetical protein